MLVLALISVFLVNTKATISVSFDHHRQHLNLTAYNALDGTFPAAESNFDFNVNSTAIPLIAVHDLIGDFNPCDESTFDLHAMDTALENWWRDANYTNEASNPIPPASRPWIAYLRRKTVQETCNGLELQWYYGYYAVGSAQKLGASGLLLDGSACPECVKGKIIFSSLLNYSHLFSYNRFSLIIRLPLLPYFFSCNPSSSLITAFFL